MDEQTLKAVDYFKIREELENYCVTSGAKKSALNLLPFDSIEEAVKALKETTEAKSFYEEEGDFPFIEFIGVEEILEKVKVLSLISGDELLRIQSALNTISEIKDIGEAYRNNFPLIYALTSRLDRFDSITEAISRAIGPDGKLLDDASPLLTILRREIKITYMRIQTILQNIIYSREYEDIVQDQIITKRNGRYVIPIRQNSRPAFQFVIQGESSSRLTLFVEPLSIVDLNNKLVDLASKEKEEEERIILELEKSLRAKMEQIESSLRTIYKLDFSFAKGKVSVKQKGEEPQIMNHRTIKLYNARHPFLPQDKVVPIDIEIGRNYHTLIITGPNTGGKTVTLKTVALLTLMAKSGMHIPAFSNSEIGFFQKIYADIGDEQSIQQNLSTFSSHMERIIKILNNADTNTLALIDELGAGTDPEEGSALGFAILKRLYESKTTVIATTHHSKLKEFPYRFPLAKNASVGFDIETLQPTYRISIGIPGESHAFIIAEKLGVPPEVLEDARKELPREYTAQQEIILRMSEDQKKIGQSAEEIERNRKEIEELKEIYEKRVKEIEEKRKTEIKKAYEEAGNIIEETKIKMNSIINNLEDYIKSQRALHDLKKEVEKERVEIESKVESTEPKAHITFTNIEEGSLVYVPNFKRQGIVLTKLEDKGKVVIQMGSIRATLSINDVEPIKEGAFTKQEREPKESVNEFKDVQVPMKIDLHGMTAEEAIDYLDKYLDSAYLVGLPYVYIVHGKGSGTLKEAITEYLRKKTHVAHFYTGSPEEGGSGVTIVYLK